MFQVQITKKIQNDNSFSTHFEVMHAEFQGGEVEVGHARTVSHRAVGHTATYISLLTHSCPPFQHLLSERLMSLGIMGAPRVPHLNPSETIVLSEHYRLWGFKGDTRGSPIMPRDVSLSDSKCWNGGQIWVNLKT